MPMQAIEDDVIGINKNVSGNLRPAIHNGHLQRPTRTTSHANVSIDTSIVPELLEYVIDPSTTM